MRTVAMVQLLLWVAGSVSGYVFAGAIHLFLLGSLLLFLIHRRLEARAAAQAVSPASILSIVLRREQDAPDAPSHERWSLPSH